VPLNTLSVSLAALHHRLMYRAKGSAPVLRHQASSRYSVVFEERRIQMRLPSHHGGDSEGWGCAVDLGAICPSDLPSFALGDGDTGALDSGRLLLFGSDGGGAGRMMGEVAG